VEILMKATRRTTGIVLFLLLGWIEAISISGARPSVSIAQPSFNISEAECLKRAEAALSGSGWTEIEPRPTWVSAIKQNYVSYIICNATSAGAVIVNIFVTFDGTDPKAELAGAERAKLLAQMEQSPHN
jgi:hypothetical protein